MNNNKKVYVIDELHDYFTGQIFDSYEEAEQEISSHYFSYGIYPDWDYIMIYDYDENEYNEMFGEDS